MRSRKKFVQWGTFLAVTLCLFLIGHLFNVDDLKFHYVFDRYEEGFNFEFGSFVPFFYGVLSVFVAGRVYSYFLRKNSLQIKAKENTKKNNGI